MFSCLFAIAAFIRVRAFSYQFESVQVANRLPDGPLIVTYVTNDGLTVDKVMNEAIAGVNVLIWHKGQLVKNGTTGQVKKL